MAEVMTYGSLVQDIQTYAERADQPFLDQIPRFIMLAENRIASEVRGLGYVRFVNGSFTPSNGVVAKPSRWRESAHFFLTDPTMGFKSLKSRSYTFCRSYWPTASNTGTPEYYCDYGYEHILVVPTPNTDLDFEWGYYERPTPLSEDNQTNWTTQYAPQLLLYGSLLEAQPFLKRPERTKEFQELFDRASAAITNEAQRRMNGDQSTQTTGLQ